MDKVLYFPYMSIPDNTTWALQILFYWDELQCIIPYSYINRPDELSPFTQNLLQEGLLKQIHPEEYIYSIRDFDKNFMDYIDHKSSNSSNIAKSSRYERIHMGKMSNIGQGLVEYGLAFQSKEWFCVEENTATEFMTYLASVLSKKTDAVPLTDTFKGLSGFVMDSNYSTISMRNKLRNSILPSLMPIPSHINDLYSIQKFKKKNHTELVAFRNHIEQFIFDLENTPKDQQNERKQRFIQSSEEQRKAIYDNMRFSFSDVTFVTLCSLLSAAFPAVDAYAANNPVELGKSIPSLMGAIYSIYANNKQHRDPMAPLAYAAYIDKRFNKRSHRNV